MLICGVILFSLLSLALFTGGSKKGTLILADASVVAADLDTYSGKELRIRGFVKPGSILRYGDEARFVITHEQKEMKVRFTGETQLPDTFTDGAPVRADGHLENNLFVASRVEAKCASKYETEYVPQTGKP